MSVSEATQMMSLLRFSINKMQELRRVLKNTNIGNFIPSESKIRKEQSELTSYLPEDHFEFGKMTFQFGSNDEITYKERAYVRVKKLIPFIETN